MTIKQDEYFMCGGVGDFITIESFLPNKPKKIYLATSRAALIGELCHYCGIEIEIIESQKSYYSKQECEPYHGYLPIQDASQLKIFKDIKDGKLKFKGSSLLNLNLPNIINTEYILVCPYTMTEINYRNMEIQDLNHIYFNTKGTIVVCGYGNFPVPDNHRVLNLMNQTSLIESVALVRYAKAIYTIDTWTASWGAQLDIPVFIKSRNQHYYENIECYAAPFKENVKVMHYFV